MLPDLQWRFQLGRQACCRRFGNDVFRRDTLFDAVLEHPVDVVTLPIAQAAEFKHRRAVADFLQLRPAQVVLQPRMPSTADNRTRALRASRSTLAMTSTARRVRQEVSAAAS
jgi:hypothetical protein